VIARLQIISLQAEAGHVPGVPETGERFFSFVGGRRDDGVLWIIATIEQRGTEI
jgi:hypothetical protein